MNVAIKRNIETWVVDELHRYAIENEIYPVFWTVTVMSKGELLEKKGVQSFGNQRYFPTPDTMSEIFLHIKLNSEGKIADKLLFLAPFWEEEQFIIKEVIKLLFKVIKSDIIKVYE